MGEILRPRAESTFQDELQALKQEDSKPRPPSWLLSPHAVVQYLMGATLSDGTIISPKLAVFAGAAKNVQRHAQHHRGGCAALCQLYLDCKALCQRQAAAAVRPRHTQRKEARATQRCNIFSRQLCVHIRRCGARGKLACQLARKLQCLSCAVHRAQSSPGRRSPISSTW